MGWGGAEVEGWGIMKATKVAGAAGDGAVGDGGDEISFGGFFFFFFESAGRIFGRMDMEVIGGSIRKWI